MYSCVPSGVCAKKIDFEIEDGKISKLHFTGGCPGNLEAISRLVEGMDIDKVIETLSGITCGNKPTSCADQLCLTLADILKGNAEDYVAVAAAPGASLNPFM
ncbi:MAG: TIGR03905 family TSCPD domain-containing protein [Desulfovibrio sp.]